MEVRTTAAAGMQPALAALRSATREHHARTEQLLRLDPGFDFSHYQQVISAFASFMQRWEAQVAAALPQRLHAWFAPRRRAGRALQDVRALGLAGSRCAGPLPIGLDTVPAVFGSLYVLEGSALGGAVVAARLREAHGVGEGNGGAYFNARGAQTAALWRDFQQRLEAEVAGPPARADACASAVQTFEALVATFRGELHVDHARHPASA